MLLHILRDRRAKLPAGVFALAVCALLLGAALAATGQSPRKRPAPARPPEKTAPPAAAVAVPFANGERLTFRVLWSKYSVNAGALQCIVVEQRDFFGHLAWHFRAVAHTMDTTLMLFAIDDEFDSYASAATLFSMQYEMYLHEQGKDQTSVYRMTTDGDPAPPNVTAVRVVSGTRDAIGFLYDLRAADWQRAPELRAPVFDGRRLYDVVARVDMPQGSITVPAGNFPAFRIALRLFDHGKELTDTRLWVWIARDAAHTPVLVEADIPFGTARIELTQKP